MNNKVITLCIVLLLAACSSEPPKSEGKTNQEPSMTTEIVMKAAGQRQPPAVKAPFTTITAQTAQQLITNEKDLLILDTRTTREIVTYGAIAGSRQASLRAIFQNELLVPKNTPILVVCAVGGRSYAAGKIMVKHGFQEIYNLSGGLDAWKKEGLPVIYPKL